MTVPMVETTINGRWTLKLPEHRAARPQWVTGWEVERLTDMHDVLGGGGHVVYDVGAEEGDLPALWASWGNDTVLFEPNDRVWPNMRAIWDANGLKSPLACFAGFAADHSSAECRIDASWPPSAFGPVIGNHGFCNLSERPDIQRVRIDTVAELVAPPSAITIDVEGAELHVLQGAEAVLRERGPVVWVSVHPEFMAEMYGHTPGDLDVFMTDLGYEGEYLGTDHEIHLRYSRS